IADYGLSGGFMGLGVLFAVVVIVAGQLLAWPPADYKPPTPPAATLAAALTRADWPAAAMLRTWQFYGLVFLFIGSAQSGLLVIANAAPMLNQTAAELAFFAAHGWLLAAYGGFVNAAGRIGTGQY